MHQPKDTQKLIFHHSCIPVWCHHSLLPPPALFKALPAEPPETAAPSPLSLRFCWMEEEYVHISNITSALPLQLIARIECGSCLIGETSAAIQKAWELNEIKCWLKCFPPPSRLTGVSVGNQKRVCGQAYLSGLTKKAGWLITLGCLQCQNLLPCELSKFSEVMSIRCYPVKLTEFPWLYRTLLYLSLQECISINELWLLSGLWGQIKIMPSVLAKT